MAILAIHDAHDAGAAIVEDGRLLSAVNEERFTKRKNDVGFPENSIKYLLKEFSDLEIEKVVVPWIGGSALAARIIPNLEVKRRALWRKEKKKPSRASMKFTNIEFKLIQNQVPKCLWSFSGRHIGGYFIRRRLERLGIKKPIVFLDHHLSHASSAYYASGFKEALVITLDGAGDGLSGTVSIGDAGELKRINQFKASDSIGVFYGAATIACDLRYSEDEGKLMSLAAYSYPSEIKELNELVYYDEGKKQLVSKCSKKYEYLLAEYLKDNILWKYNREAFAYAVQRHVEQQVLKIIKQYINETGIRNIAVAGGFFSNVIVNMLINQLPEVKDFFVFPQMGDGGLAAGSAYYVDYAEHKKLNGSQLTSTYFGPIYSDDEIEKQLKKYRGSFSYEEKDNIAAYVGDAIARENKIVLWFQGRMEYGPRALGNRSVLARADNPENRNAINIIIKKRPYYQPFASTVLEEDAKKLFEPYPRPNRFMTVAYNVKEKYREDLIAASHIDGTTRPQVLGEENKLYKELIKRVSKSTGIGAVLNTSFNKHGMPIVMSPEDALWTLQNTGAKYLAIGNFFVEKNS